MLENLLLCLIMAHTREGNREYVKANLCSLACFPTSVWLSYYFAWPTVHARIQAVLKDLDS